MLVIENAEAVTETQVVELDTGSETVSMNEVAADAFEAQMQEIRGEVLKATNPVGEMVSSITTSLTTTREVHLKRAAEARMKGFEGDACGSCGNFTLVRNGTCMKCNTCGSTSGCS
jgi:ribonucleoside-diphosphate reductase alpha chain